MELCGAPREVAAIALLLLLSSVATVQSFTIPAQYDGFAFPPAAADGRAPPVVLEAFFDPMCPDCRSAWPTLKTLAALYGSSLSLIIHAFPVPFHHNAFFSARTLHIANGINASSTIPLLELIFENQESFSNSATESEAPADVIQRFVALGEKAGLSTHSVYGGFLDATTDQATRISFKYGCARYVTATPTYLVNGVPTAADETWSVGKWRSILEPLLNRKKVALEL